VVRGDLKSMRRALACALFAASLFGQTPVKTSVCELLANPSAWDGRIVEIEEDIYFTGFWVPTVFGGLCESKSAAGGLIFRNLIGLGETDYRLMYVNDGGYDPASESDHEFAALLLRVDPNHEHIHGTITGLFENRVPTESLNWSRVVHQRPADSYGPYPGRVMSVAMTGLRIEKNSGAYQTIRDRDPSAKWPRWTAEAMWREINQNLHDSHWQDYWDEALKDAVIPAGYLGVRFFKGLVFEPPNPNPGELLISNSDPSVPEIKLKFVDKTGAPARLSSPIPAYTEVEFAGVAREFRRDPFLLTIEVNIGNPEEFRVVRSSSEVLGKQ